MSQAASPPEYNARTNATRGSACAKGGRSSTVKNQPYTRCGGSLLRSSHQLRWLPGEDSLVRGCHRESSSVELGADHDRIDVREHMLVFASPFSELFMTLMRWVIEILIDEEHTTPTAHYPPKLGDRRIEVGPVMHRVD
jgi:hypothetical protein